MDQQLSNHHALPVAIFIATVIHVLLILSINFDHPNIGKNSRSTTKITLLTKPAKKAPKKAEFLAQANQIGEDQRLDKPRPVAKKPSNISRPLKKQQAQQKRKPQDNIKQKTTVKKTPAINLPKLSKQILRQQVAQLGEKIHYQKTSPQQKRIKSIQSINAHQFLAAQYILDWTMKIKKMGQLNYPAIIQRLGFSSSLTMTVGINPDGSLYTMHISQSSGYPNLDEAAKRIVLISSPFAPLPKELLKEIDVLMIIRIWKFSDEFDLPTR